MNNQVYIDIIARNKTLKAFEEVQSSTEKTKQSILNLKNALVGLGAGVVVRSIINTTARFEDLRTSLASVTGSAEQGAEAFDFISKFATKTQFGIEDLSKSFIKLKAAGITPTEELLNVFTNTAAITTDQIGSLEAVTDLYARTVSGGLGLEEIQRLGDRGVPILKILEEQLGLTRGQISEFGKTAEGAKQIVDAFGKGIQAQYGSATSNLVGNLSTQFSNLQIALLNNADAFGQGLAPAIKDTTQEITDLLVENQKLVQSLGKDLGGALSGTLKLVLAFTKGIGGLNDTLKQFTNDQVTLFDLLVRGSNFFGRFADILEETSNGLENGANAFDNFRQAEDESLKSLEEYNEELAKLNSGFEEFKKNAEDTVTLTNVFKIKTEDEAEDDIFTQLKKLREQTGVGLINQIKAQKRQELDVLEDINELGLLSEEEYLKQREKLNLLYSEKIKKAKENEVSQKVLLEKQGQDQIIGAVGDALSKVSGLNKNAFRAYQAFQIAMATVNTFRAVSNAMTTYPFPLNIGVAGAELARGLAIVAQIRSIAPPRQTGGRVFAGQPYTVGENGRETFVPESNGTILPNGAGMGATNVYITVNANDTQGFDDLLVKRRSVIVNVINDALNSQGKEALV
jgi:hypothetical protein